MMILQGVKITLRPMEPEEVTLIHVWANNPEVMPFWYGEKKTLEQIKGDWRSHYFSDNNPYTGRCFAILKGKNPVGKPIGMISYNRIDRDNRSVDIDMIIGQTKDWGQGYGADSLRTFARYLFDRFDLNRIWLGTYIYNKRAIRAYEKAGFQKEGVLREDAWVASKFVDTVVLSILRREFFK
jgi:RimJ/RimL family protein N-acetyltransferase